MCLRGYTCAVSDINTSMCRQQNNVQSTSALRATVWSLHEAPFARRGDSTRTEPSGCKEGRACEEWWSDG